MLKPIISIILDSRRSNKDKLFPIRLRATFQVREKKTKKWVVRHYPLKVYCSEADFAAAKSGKPRTKRQTEIRTLIVEAENTARKFLQERTAVSPEIFDSQFSLDFNYNTVGDVFNSIINEMDAAGRIGNRDLYRGARNSIARFLDPDLVKMKTRRGPDKVEVNISWYEVSTDWVKRYHQWLLKNVSQTTASIYLRHLRGAFNRAIDKHIVKKDVYPFGKNGVKIPTTRARKIALNEVDKNRLLERNDWAVDFWVLSYYCYGLNVMDIALLKISDIQDDLIMIRREKSKNTSGKVMVIPIRQEVKEIISRHGNKSLNPSDYVFPILTPGLTANQIKNRVKDFISKVNEGLREVRKELKLSAKLTTYTARHTFANIALKKGASKEFIQEALGHASMVTTEYYLDGIDLETKRAISAKL